MSKCKCKEIQKTQKELIKEYVFLNRRLRDIISIHKLILTDDEKEICNIHYDKIKNLKNKLES